MIMRDHFGNVPFALIHSNGRPVAFTREEYEQAKAIARICKCGRCDCCNVVAYVTETTGKDN
jgi:hypothetical protein